MMRALWRFVFLVSLALLPVLYPFGQAEPSWPQPFQVLEGENASFGFVVTQPGLISIAVTAQGAPVAVILSGPVAQPIQQTGTGSVRLAYNVTAADVQKSSLWMVRIAAANPLPAPLNRLPQAVASGTISVQHPPANAQVAQAELQSRASASKLPAQIPAKQSAASVVAAKKAAYAKQLADQQAAQKQQLMLQVSQARPIALAPSQARLTPSTMAGKTTASSSSADTGVAPAGSSQVQTVAVPKMQSLSVSHGQPGDPVSIAGSGFGATQGKVHFIVASGKDLTATSIDYWNDSQIITTVPDVSGVLAYAGQVYVEQAGGQKSNAVPFAFNPAMDFAQLVGPGNRDSKVKDPSSSTFRCMLVETNTCVDHSSGGDLFGHKENDEFFLNTTLKNGWVVDSVSANVDYLYSGGDAYLVDSRPGTSSPYAKVHWWINAFSDVSYNLTITIKGPKGLPYQ